MYMVWGVENNECDARMIPPSFFALRPPFFVLPCIRFVEPRYLAAVYGC